MDFGIRGFDLAFVLMDEYQAIILIDAIPRGGNARDTLHHQPDWDALDGVDAEVEMHGMNPAKVLAMVKSMGGEPKRILFVGCEPSSPLYEGEERIGLSEPVEKAIDEAINIVERLVHKLEGEQDERILESSAGNPGNCDRSHGVAGH